MILSATQFKQYQRCPRLWWFERVQRIPGPNNNQYSLTFGKVLHSVLDRYLSATPDGRDANGNAVDLYPEGWETDAETGERILPQDEEVVKELVDLAIHEGVIARRHRMATEQEFLVPIVPGISVKGFIDVLTPYEVQDHKSTKNMRYALSPEKLAEDTQMLIYARVSGVTKIRHNVFDRIHKKIRKTEVEVTREDLDAHWDSLKALALEMRDLKEDDHTKVKCNFPEACNDYGGCRFIPVCAGQETLENLKKRYLRLANGQ